jgi:hypothetical protein
MVLQETKKGQDDENVIVLGLAWLAVLVFVVAALAAQAAC